jgi:hypothetical protein
MSVPAHAHPLHQASENVTQASTKAKQTTDKVKPSIMGTPTRFESFRLSSFMGNLRALMTTF